MAFKRLFFKNRVVEHPRTYTMTTNQDGTITLTPAPGEVIVPGVSLSAQNLNTEEEGLAHVSATLDMFITMQQAETRDNQNRIEALESAVAALADAESETE